MSGAEWLRAAGKDVCPEAARVAELVDWLFDGIYHEQDAVVRADWSNPHFVELRISRDLATFDSSTLTRLVVGAHDAAIRVEISACSMRTIRLMFHPRPQRGGRMWERHPSIEEALAAMQRPNYWRQSEPVS